MSNMLAQLHGEDFQIKKEKKRLGCSSSPLEKYHYKKYLYITVVSCLSLSQKTEAGMKIAKNCIGPQSCKTYGEMNQLPGNTSSD